MAATTVNETLFGAPGVSDPYAFEPGLVGIKRRINFNVAKTAANGVYALLPLPRGMVVTGVRVEEVDKCVAGNVSLLIADASDATDDTALGSAVTVGGDSVALSVQNLASPVALAANKIVSVKTTTAQTKGAVILTVLGYLSDGESIESIDIALPAWRSGQTAEQALANVSGGDPYNANRSGVPIYPVANDQ